MKNKVQPLDLAKLATELEQATTNGMLRFGLLKGEGWVVSGSESTVRVLCTLWNNRHEIARILRAAIAPPCAQCGKPSITELDGDHLCWTHANEWLRGEADAARASADDQEIF